MPEKCHFEVPKEKWEPKIVTNPLYKRWLGWLFEPKTIDAGGWVKTTESGCALTAGFTASTLRLKKCCKAECPIWQIGRA